ncbi:MAG: hypothetical protein ACYTA5_08710 [Planctomycetota bacterium]
MRSDLHTVRWLIAVSVAVMFWVLASFELRGEDAPGTAEVERLATFGSMDTEDEFPAIGCDERGKVWVSWISYDGKSDSVLAARLDGTESTSPIVLGKTAGDHWRPAMCRDGEGRLWVTWARNEKGNWDVWAKYLAGGEWSKALRLTRGEGNDFCQTLAVDSMGKVWMVWQSVVDGNYEILLAPVAPQGLGQPLNVSRHAASDWEPAIAASNDGSIFIAWDSYRNGSYDILMSELKDDRPGEPMGVATSPDYEAHATLAVDGKNRVWIAWDNGGPHWGTEERPRNRLHGQREIEIRCLSKGRLFEPIEDLSSVLRKSFARFCELPELMVDGDGRLWLFIRHLTDHTRKRKDGKPTRGAQGLWNPFMLCYEDGKWSRPQKLPQSNGRNDMRVATCLGQDGQVWLAWPDDGRKPTRAEEPQNHNVHAAMLKMPEVVTNALPVKSLNRKLGSAPQLNSPAVKPLHHTVTANGKTYKLLYGDAHRHTDLSRCAMNYDGSLRDTYRYAIDVAKLDFMAITDHDQDLLKHRFGRAKNSPLQHYLWWRSEKYCDLFYMEGKFLPIYGYEHGGSFVRRGGHKNVLYLKRGNPCLEEDSPKDLFKALEGREAVVIPHQLADGPSATDWSKWNPEYERIAEIYQVRGSYEFMRALPQVKVTREGHYFRDVLAMGIRIGTIASSDHGLVSGAYAGVYCSEFSRRGVMEGLRSRRTFGAMDRMVIEFRLSEELLGEKTEVESVPEFEVLVKGEAALTKVQVVKDGQVVHTINPRKLESRFIYSDPDLKPGGESYYYVRCEQENEKYGWSSPIWVRRTK